MMKRITLLVASVLALVGMSTLAEAKPSETVAVLGLEVIDNGAVDQKSTQAAQALADELRSQASRGKGKYALAPNSAKDLLELKLLSNCGDEAKSCMASIGRDLRADRLLYGKLERLKNGYQVSLKLLNTRTEAMETTTSELIPIEDLHGTKITSWSRSLYSRLTGMPEAGTLRIDANVDRATVYVDGKVVTTLRDGSAKVDNLNEGVHEVAIEAEGYKRYEADVSISAGETEPLTVSLSKTKAGGGGGGGSEGDGNTWKYSFYAGAVLTAGSGLMWAYYGKQAGYIGGSSLIDDKNSTWDALQAEAAAEMDANGDATLAVDHIKGNETGSVINGSCNRAKTVSTPSTQTLEDFQNACQAGADAATRATALGIGFGVFALATGYLGYRAFYADDNKERQFSKKKSKNKTRVVVVPQLSPESIGAGLSLEF